MKLDKCNFIIPLSGSNDKEITCYVPQPNEIEMNRLFRLLGTIFSVIRKGNQDILVVLKDWRLILEDSLGDTSEEKRDALLGALDVFFERSLASATIFDEDGLDVTLDEEETEIFKGTLLFLSALYRYSPNQVVKNEMKGYYTSLNASEFKSSQKKSSSQPAAEEKKEAKVKIKKPSQPL